MEIKDYHWKMIRELFNKSFYTTLHFSLATVTPDNLPHVTPIGSIVLRDNKTGFPGRTAVEEDTGLPPGSGSDPHIRSEVSRGPKHTIIRKYD